MESSSYTSNEFVLEAADMSLNQFKSCTLDKSWEECTSNVSAISSSALTFGSEDRHEPNEGLNEDLKYKEKLEREILPMLLKSWQKKRGANKKYQHKMKDLKAVQLDIKEQLHLFNMLFLVEKNRNDHLNKELETMKAESAEAQYKCDELTSVICGLKEDLITLLHALEAQDREHDELCREMEETKSELRLAMECQEELESKLKVTQKKVEDLQKEQEDLLKESVELQVKAEKSDWEFRCLMLQKSTELKNALILLKSYQLEYKCLKDEEENLLSACQEKALISKSKISKESGKFQPCQWLKWLVLDVAPMIFFTVQAQRFEAYNISFDKYITKGI